MELSGAIRPSRPYKQKCWFDSNLRHRRPHGRLSTCRGSLIGKGTRFDHEHTLAACSLGSQRSTKPTTLDGRAPSLVTRTRRFDSGRGLRACPLATATHARRCWFDSSQRGFASSPNGKAPLLERDNQRPLHSDPLEHSPRLAPASRFESERAHREPPFSAHPSLTGPTRNLPVTQT